MTIPGAEKPQPKVAWALGPWSRNHGPGAYATKIYASCREVVEKDSKAAISNLLPGVSQTPRSLFHSKSDPGDAPVMTDFTAVRTIAELRQHIRTARSAGASIGCVPTMGALHSGHVSLMESARAATDFVVVTIFVNPTQFGPNEDLDRYPRPLEADLKKCREAGVDLVFHPTVEEVYPAADATFVEVPGLSERLEGAHRAGHFRGVTTIVLKLFNMVLPDVAFFGQKDYQQQLLIRHMVSDLDVPVEIRTCPTIRETDGLALSSRNAYLSPDERHTALALSRTLRHAEARCTLDRQEPAVVRAEMCEVLNAIPGLTLDYATIADAESLEELDAPAPEMVALIAARVGKTRLIDNIRFSGPPEGREPTV